MDKKLYYILLIILFSCSKQNNQQELSLNGEYYTIDLDANKESSLPLSSLFKNVRTIILETNEDSFIGEVNNLQVFDGYIYIFDSDKAKNLFVFDLEGKFIRKIGRLGNGPGEYTKITDFTLDTDNRIIYLRNQDNRVHKYNLDGTYIHTITIQAPNSHAFFIQYYNGKLYSNYLGWQQSQDDYMLLQIDPADGKILFSSLPLEHNKGWNEPFFYGHNPYFMSRMNNPPRYNQMFMNFIVSIGDEITPYIELKSKNLTTEEDIESFRGEGAIRVNSRNVLNSKKIFNVNCFIENNDYLCFRCGLNPLYSFVVLLYKETGDVKLANYLSNDLIFKKDEKGTLGRFLFSDEKGAYEILNTQSLSVFDDFQASMKNDEIVPDLNKLDQLIKLNANSNPVIFFYEYK